MEIAGYSLDDIRRCIDWMKHTHDLGFLPEYEQDLRARGSTPWAIAACTDMLLLADVKQVLFVNPLEPAYDLYSFKVLPWLGERVAGDAAAYRYLAESIRMHPSQAELKAMMKEAGFGHVDVHNLSAGIVALHVGLRC